MAYPSRTTLKGKLQDPSPIHSPKGRVFASDEDERISDVWEENLTTEKREVRQRELETTRFDEPEDDLIDTESEIDPAFFMRDMLSSWEQITSDDTVGLYFKEMSQVPLLSLEEEVNLAKRIEQGSHATCELSNGGCTFERRKECPSGVGQQC